MSTEENKATYRRWIEEGWNKHNPDLLDEIADAEYVTHGAGGPETIGRDAFKNVVNAIFTAFPDVHLTLEDEIAEGDRVASRWTLTGTHQGEYLGIPPTGRNVRMTGMSVSRFVDGKLVEGWNEMDNLGFLQQLGAIPPLGEGEG